MDDGVFHNMLSILCVFVVMNLQFCSISTPKCKLQSGVYHQIMFLWPTSHTLLGRLRRTPKLDDSNLVTTLYIWCDEWYPPANVSHFLSLVTPIVRQGSRRLLVISWHRTEVMVGFCQPSLQKSINLRQNYIKQISLVHYFLLVKSQFS